MTQKKDEVTDEATDKLTSEKKHRNTTSGLTTRLFFFRRPFTWVLRHWKTTTRVSAALAALATGIWAVFTFIYPTLILPRIEPGYLQVMLKAEQVGVSGKYSIYQISFELKNAGLSRLYVPSTYYLVRAFNIEASVENSRAAREKHIFNITNSVKSVMFPSTNIAVEQTKATTNSAPDRLKMWFTNLAPSERTAIIAQANNVLFISKWEDALPKDRLEEVIDLRGPYDLDDESFVYVQFGRLTGITELLDPGEISSASILTFVPTGYDVLSIDCRGIASKKWRSNITWIGAPHPHGIAIIPFQTGPNLTNVLANFRNSVGLTLTNGTIARLENLMDKSSFYFRQRTEIYISRHQQPVSTSATNALTHGVSKSP